jgi:hypothetical protein
MVVGFVGGSFPTTKAHRLQFLPGESQDYEALRAALRGHNERLAEHLDVSPEEALALEAPH